MSHDDPECPWCLEATNRHIWLHVAAFLTLAIIGFAIGAAVGS
jgi:hypothetical protein